MPATIEIIFDDKAVLAGFDRLAAAGRDARPLMAQIGSAMVDSSRMRFTTNIAPDGVRWPGLSPAYDAFRRPGPMLVQSSALRGSLTFRAASGEVQWGSPMIYAGVHQFGATITPKNAKALVFRMGAGGGIVRVKSVTIPARPYLGVSAGDELEIRFQADRYLRQVFYGA